MVVAYVSSLTLLPALIRAVNPPPEPKPLTLAALASADAFLKRHRVAVIVATVLIVVAGLPALPRLQFNFNPLALENQASPALAALFRLGKEVPLNTARVLVQADAAGCGRRKACGVARGGRDLDPRELRPGRSRSKTADHRSRRKRRWLRPCTIRRDPPPSDAENVAALKRAVQALQDTADQHSGAGADAARRLADALDKLAQADAAQRARATDAFIHPLQLDLDDVGQSLMAERVTRASLPPDLVRDWVAPDGRVRIEVWPKGDANDNATISRFARAVQAVQPGATGEAIGSTEWGSTIVEAFAEAAALALLSIAILLWIVLRRLTDVLVTLIPLLVAGIVTLEICALDEIPAQLCEHHRVAGAARHRRRLQDLLRHGMAARGEQFPGISADAGGVLQHAPDRHRLRQSVAVQPAGDIEHGQTAGAVACLHAHLGGVVPARPHG